MLYYLIVARFKLLLITNPIKIMFIVLLIISKNMLILEIHNRVYTWRLVLIAMELMVLNLLLLLVVRNLWIKIAVRRLFSNGSKSISTLEDRLTSWIHLHSTLIGLWSWSLTALLAARKACCTAFKFLGLEFSKKFD